MEWHKHEKHTLGPWKAEMTTEGCEECKGYVVLRDNGHHDVIARVPYFGPWVPYNAQLIATAPDMLDELRYVADGLAHIDTPWAKERLGFVMEVIEKATKKT